MKKTKKINTAIATLVILITMGAANAVETTTTTTQYTQTIDESSISSQRLIYPEKSSDKEILRLLDAKINSYADLRNDVWSSAHDGVISLKGTVDKTSQKDFTGMMAAAIPGVIRVDNLIAVK